MTNSKTEIPSIEEYMKVKQQPLFEFRAWTKIARLFRDTVMTEKLDGTNGAIGIIRLGLAAKRHPDLGSPAVKLGKFSDGTEYAIYAQSRRRIISPFDDNYGFAAWVHDNAATLAEDLGPGLHFGEWWGNGIQRGYGQPQKIFSLFNVHKWEHRLFWTENLRCVPVLDRYTMNTERVMEVLEDLRVNGSRAALGFKPAEGLVVFHPQSQALFKVTLENDDLPKSLSQERRIKAVENAA